MADIGVQTVNGVVAVSARSKYVGALNGAAGGAIEMRNRLSGVPVQARTILLTNRGQEILSFYGSDFTASGLAISGCKYEKRTYLYGNAEQPRIVTDIVPS